MLRLLKEIQNDVICRNHGVENKNKESPDPQVLKSKISGENIQQEIYG